LIYVENNNGSRIIQKRLEGGMIKPYESLRNIMVKNNLLKAMNEEEEKVEEYNSRIEI
jgi:hypothetical protein